MACVVAHVTLSFLFHVPAEPGDSIGINIKGLGKDEKVTPGDIMYLEKEGVLKPVKEFTALVTVQVCLCALFAKREVV